MTDVDGDKLADSLMETLVQVYDQLKCAQDFHKAQADITSPDSPDFDASYDPVC